MVPICPDTSTSWPISGRRHQPGGRCLPARAGATVDGLDTFDHTFTQWLQAEARGDPVALDALLDVDFRGDDPRGFVLTKQEWMARYRDGDVVNAAIEWEDVHVRLHVDTAVARGIQSQSVCYRGEDWSGRFRATLVAVRRDGRWSIVNLQLNRLEEPSAGTGGDGAGAGRGRP